MFQERAVRGEDKRTGTLLPFAVVSYPEPVSLPTQGGLCKGPQMDRHCPAFPGENPPLPHWLLQKEDMGVFWRANVGSYSAAGGLGVSCILPLLLPERS